MSAVTTFSKDQSQDEIVNRYSELVNRIAYHLTVRLPATVQVEDLIQSGLIGLLHAAKNFDETKGASFETYAGIRIRGAMIDEVRKGDWAPRSVHRNTRRVAQAVREVVNKNKREARDIEVAKEMGVEMKEFHHILKDTRACQLRDFDDPNVDNDLARERLAFRMPEPSLGAEKHYLNNHLINEIANLPERERMIVSLYYVKELNLKEIGKKLGVSESRVSQIHSSAMSKLNTKVQEWK